METIRAWAVGLCLVSVGGMILRRLAPEKGSGTVFRVLLSAFFIGVFVSPFCTVFSEEPLWADTTLDSEISASLLEETVTRQLNDAVTSAVTRIADSTLGVVGIETEKIDVITDTAADGGIYILRVDVTLSPKSRGRRSEARQALVRRLETEVNVKEAEE